MSWYSDCSQEYLTYQAFTNSYCGEEGAVYEEGYQNTIYFDPNGNSYCSWVGGETYVRFTQAGWGWPADEAIADAEAAMDWEEEAAAEDWMDESVAEDNG